MKLRDLSLGFVAALSLGGSVAARAEDRPAACKILTQKIATEFVGSGASFDAGTSAAQFSQCSYGGDTYVEVEVTVADLAPGPITDDEVLGVKNFMFLRDPTDPDEHSVANLGDSAFHEDGTYEKLYVRKGLRGLMVRVYSSAQPISRARELAIEQKVARRLLPML